MNPRGRGSDIHWPCWRSLDFQGISPFNLAWYLIPKQVAAFIGSVLAGQVIYESAIDPDCQQGHVTNAARDARMARNRRRPQLFAFLCVAGLLAASWAWWTHHRFRSSMQEIESEIVAGRYAIACRKLDILLSWKADPQGEIVYLLGSCELARGRNKAAGEASAGRPGVRILGKSNRGAGATSCMNPGSSAAAERLVSDAAQDPRNDRTALLVLLVPMFNEQGRLDEAERLIEQRLEFLNAAGNGALEAAIKLVHQHIELTLKATPVETILAVLERASTLAPDDDRIGRVEQTWRSGPVRTMKPSAGSMPASSAVRRMSRSGLLDCTGASRPTVLTS